MPGPAPLLGAGWRLGVSRASGSLDPGRGDAGALAEEEPEVDVDLADWLQEPGIRERAAIDGLEASLRREVGNDRLRSFVVGGYEHLHRRTGAGFGGEELSEDRVEPLHHLGLRREPLQ